MPPSEPQGIESTEHMSVWRLKLWLGLSAALLIASIAFVFHSDVVRVYEDVSFALRPSAPQALTIGSKYFDAQDSELYDIERARLYFDRAIAADPSYPYAHHQRARIAFLEGKFDEALSYADIEIERHGELNPNAYYVRALILGYQEKYLEAAADYESYFSLTQANWAAINDYAWVLMRADLYEGALEALDWGLSQWPDNPWLLHNKVIALFELGEQEEAVRVAEKAVEAVGRVGPEDWLMAYPGNDPLVASEGLATFRVAVLENHRTVVDSYLQGTSSTQARLGSTGESDARSCPQGQQTSPLGCVCEGTRWLPIQGSCNTQCVPAAYCGGEDVTGDGVGDIEMQRTARCVEVAAKTPCRFGCSEGRCASAPLGSGKISAAPLRVKRGETTSVTWSTKNMLEGSCALTEDSALIDDAQTGASGLFASSPLLERTTFSLVCMEISGIPFSTSVLVEVDQD